MISPKPREPRRSTGIWQEGIYKALRSRSTKNASERNTNFCDPGYTVTAANKNFHALVYVAFLEISFMQHEVRFQRHHSRSNDVTESDGSVTTELSRVKKKTASHVLLCIAPRNGKKKKKNPVKTKISYPCVSQYCILPPPTYVHTHLSSSFSVKHYRSHIHTHTHTPA